MQVPKVYFSWRKPRGYKVLSAVSTIKIGSFLGIKARSLFKLHDNIGVRVVYGKTKVAGNKIEEVENECFCTTQKELSQVTKQFLEKELWLQ